MLAIHLTYNVYFHPLSRFNGPFLWRAFRFPFIKELVTGTLPHRIWGFHEHYGSFVRVAPDELSIIDPAAWRDVYPSNFDRAPQYSNKPPGKAAENLISANHFDHVPFRKVLAPAFSDKSISKFEGVIASYIDLLISDMDQRVEIEE